LNKLLWKIGRLNWVTFRTLLATSRGKHLATIQRLLFGTRPSFVARYSVLRRSKIVTFSKREITDLGADLSLRRNLQTIKAIMIIAKSSSAATTARAMYRNMTTAATSTRHLSAFQVISVKLHLRDGRTDGRRDASLRPSVRSFVRLSLCQLCLSGASILWGNEPRCFIEI